MKTQAPTSLYKGFRFPAEIIGYCIWLYFRFSLSFRDVEEIMAERGIVLTYETIRQWCLKCGQTYAHELKRRRPKTGDKWHLDEVYLKINGKTHYLWRAVDQYGNVLDILVQSRRNKQAAKKFFRKLLKGLQYAPRVIITDELASYAAAKREILPSVEHRQHKGLNNRAERSHPLGRPNGFSPLLGLSWITFGRSGIVSRPGITMPSCRIASRCGTR